MKLLLTSSGLSNSVISKSFLDKLSKPVSESTVFVIAYAQNDTEEFYVNESKREISQLGFNDISVINLNHVVCDLSSLKFDVIYVCGGNTFSILSKLRETGLDVFIINQIRSGAIFIGVSAGSIIAGPDIEIAGWGSEGDENIANLKDLSGLNLTNIAIFPHFHNELTVEVEKFKEMVKYEVIAINDSQAVIIDGSNYKIIGV